MSTTMTIYPALWSDVPFDLKSIFTFVHIDIDDENDDDNIKNAIVIESNHEADNSGHSQSPAPVASSSSWATRTFFSTTLIGASSSSSALRKARMRA